MNRVSEAHGVDEVPVLSRSDLGVVAGATITELVVPVEEEIKIDVMHDRSHSFDAHTFGPIGTSS